MPDVAGLYPKPIAVVVDGKVLRRIEWNRVEIIEEPIVTTAVLALEVVDSAAYSFGMGNIASILEAIDIAIAPTLDYSFLETAHASYRVV